MPAHVYWIDEPHIMAVDYSGEVSMDDIRAVIAICITALSENPVHFLVDFTQATSFDPQIIELSSFSEWLYHRNARWFSYVRLTGLYKNLLQLRHPQNVKFFHERAEAEDFLRQALHIVIDN